VIHALILDFGGVLARPQSTAALERLATAAGLSQNDFVRRYWQHRRDYDDGLPAAEYWTRVLECEGSADPRKLAGLIDADIASWTEYRDELWEIAAAFRAPGGRTAMLSNGVPEIVEVFRRERDLDAFFDAVVISYEVGCSKPDPKIYRLCLDRLGVDAARALFVDDLPQNLETAAELGMQTLHFTSDADLATLRSRLRL
jgi:putative hydrolase of the HAD superfamily